MCAVLNRNRASYHINIRLHVLLQILDETKGVSVMKREKETVKKERGSQGRGKDGDVGPMIFS